MATRLRETPELHATPRPDDVDLLDFAATRTVLTGGTVHSLERDDMPAGSEVAALFRF